MKIQPLDERVLVEPATEEEKTASGIIIPDTAKEKPRRGQVVAVGNDEELQKVLKVGDSVLYGKYAGDELQYDGKDYLILSRSDILAKLA
ncbi:MAG TPA: co-chaperone GroES [Candidatus Marinimicrobia bacterium]|nr:MAG: co-chaperone GroES [Candidatus Marinimicrobia bacterium CG1_02_48_14]PIZ69320.1 MAG: co-chaperone GroES [Candidatus Marinimicrobia bacterium CG_4_10_14_0_2_um_filter_48_9]PJA54355.1 MAG: co-chaperone GroES [Candidatus Marinimicrobia bacterium CG_4_9_14_3_um_filter_48_9]HCW77123.1 co-chaperone GroES [Candidatus Neomarinimicrobiota bacterium]